MGAVNYTEEDLKDHVGVGAVIKDSSGNILMQDHIKYGFFTIPVGKAEPGQTPEEALKQELLEECRIQIIRCKELCSKEHVYTRNGKSVRVTKHLFEILEYLRGIVNAEPHKHRSQKFYSIEEIKNMPYLSDATLLYLNCIGIQRSARIWLHSNNLDFEIFL